MRVLAVPADRAAREFEFQFSHLSIQEHFLAVDLVEGAAPEFWQQGTDVTLNLKRNQNVFRIGGANLGQALADSLSSQPLKLTPTGFEALKALVTEDVMLSELDLTGSTFEDFFSLQRFRNVRTLRLAQCRKLKGIAQLCVCVGPLSVY